MGLLKRRKNKKFSYEPRFYKGEGSPYEIKHKFDDYRTTVGDTPNFKQKLNRAINDYKSNSDSTSKKRFLIIVGILILIVLFIIDFDLTIFFKN
tara:strand:- start:718 stop:999 length:282 start_codon:yes stop_codon:yes gene_type:complete